MSALIVWSFADQIVGLLELYFAAVPHRLVLATALTVFFTLPNVFGWKPLWKQALWVAGAALVGLLVLAVALSAQWLGSMEAPPRTRTGASAPLLGMAALLATAWLIEVLTGQQRRERVVSLTLLGFLGGPLLAGALGLLGWLSLPAGFSLPALADRVVPGVGGPLLLGLAAVTTAVVWQAMSHLMLRQVRLIGADGVLPAWLLGTSRRWQTPVRLAVLQGALTLGVAAGTAMLLRGPQETSLRLAYLAGLMFLGLQIGVNLAAIALAQHPRSLKRSFRLPLYPVIPAVGVAINFLLLFAFPRTVLLIGAVWLLLGLLAYWQGGRERMRTSRLGVTVFQDVRRRPEVTSEFPVLVSVANPDTAFGLATLGAAAARLHGGHVVLLQVIKVPDQLPLDARRYEAKEQLGLLERLLQHTESLGVPVEGVTRLSRSITQGILDTLTEEAARFVVIGAPAPTVGEEQAGFGLIVDSVLEDAPCTVGVVRGEWGDQPRRILVPVSGGEEAHQAGELALALAAQANGEVTLLHVAQTKDGREGLDSGRALLSEVQEGLESDGRISTQVVFAKSPTEGILEAVQEQDMILLGTGDPNFLEDRHFGQLPLEVAEKTNKPVVLVRSYAGLPTHVARKAWWSLSEVFPTLSGEEQIEVFQRMRRAARPDINYFVLITLSAVIATLGLLLNSPAVVIGAMLVAPLMSPIVAIGIGVTFGDVRTLRRSVAATLQGILMAIFIAIVMTLFLPVSEASPEVLARTRPNLIDLLVALASGMAGAYAIGRKEVGEALPGVAIAAALLPPLASVGVGLALGSATIAGGALLLFTTNLIAIVFSSSLIFLLLGIRPPRRAEREQRLRQGLLISVISLLVVSLPLAFTLWRVVAQDRIEEQARAVIGNTIVEWAQVELLELDVQQGWGEVTITGTLHAADPISNTQLLELQRRLDEAIRSKITIRLFAVRGVFLESGSP